MDTGVQEEGSIFEEDLLGEAGSEYSLLLKEEEYEEEEESGGMGGGQGGNPWQSRCEYSLDLKEKHGREKLNEKRNDQAVVKMPARDMPKSERDAALAAAKREMVETTAAVNILSSARSNQDRKWEARYGESVNEPLASKEGEEEMKRTTAKLTEELELATTALQDVEARYGETVNKMQKEMQQLLQLNQKLDEQLKKESAKAMHASTSLLQLNRNLEEQLQEAAAKQAKAMHSSTPSSLNLSSGGYRKMRGLSSSDERIYICRERESSSDERRQLLCLYIYTGV